MIRFQRGLRPARRGRAAARTTARTAARTGAWLAAAWLAAAVPGCSGFHATTLGDVLGGGALDDATITNGLREALQVGTQRAVAATSRPDGFLANPRIRIPMPQELTKVAKTLRSAGLGGHVDDFELAMNRAAEQASGEAVDVFWSVLKRMTFADARAILHGEDDAATAFFRRTAGEELRGRFHPVVAAKMSELGYVRKYDELVRMYTALPLTTKPAFRPEDYVTDRALDGLFTILADEEKRIRDDPVARTTALLRRVFGAPR